MYKTEFPRFVLDVTLPEGFEDHSWHNDAMPHFSKQIGDDKFLLIWIDYSDKKLSEYGGKIPRFIAEIQHHEQQLEFFTTDIWSDILKFIKGAQ